ncbi:hypothetical protein DUNSADRAFT_1012 [Dunaliella salina]|uniref:FAD-dependent oxidoreductase domain-containing protein 1 n=1 Tax=Dunaliella salina TaxID=3046 RepID=A0ABQ7FY40_DUNSA|nr:hypothetical protein DUNSADRAFT_1012 [Dunaliella salina]|eukprot:KAF5827274.1 hypothetical protein DUNSADRAFT_1012 [Dunaliella salina]
MMEMSYTKHYAQAAQQHGQPNQPQNSGAVAANSPSGAVSNASEGSKSSAELDAATGIEYNEASRGAQGSEEASKGMTADITFTATSSASGSLLLGSSREFVDAEGDVSAQASPVVVEAILERAQMFLPGLAGVSVDPNLVRVGLRPFAVGGYPMIGPVPGHPGLYVAAGHEGSGLALSPATAHLLASYVLEEPADMQAETLQEVLPATRLLLAEL